MRRHLVTWALLMPLLAAAAPPTAVVTTPQVRAELVAHAPEGAAAGKTLWLGLKIEHQPHWHTYWKNPGDSGQPTTLSWTLPGGVRAGDIEWPTPVRLPIGPLLNYGYEGTVLLPVPVTLPADFRADMLAVTLRAEWLVCKEVCIPEGGDFSLELPAAAATAAHADLFARARAAVPQVAEGATGSVVVQGTELVVQVAGLPAAWRGQALGFLPETEGVIHNAAVPRTQWQGDAWTAWVPLDPQRSDSPTVMPVVLTLAGAPAGLRVQLPVSGAWPSPSAAASPLPAPANAPGGAPAAQGGPGGPDLALALLLALAGGALLNLMPCVFPVLSLKVLGFAGQSQDRRGLLQGGLAYTAGVVLSFAALAGLLLALRAGGEQLGWGFQLQSPAVVALLAALFTLIGLNLAGVFEFGSVLPGSWAAARAKHPAVDAFLTGILAVAVASPCTAPFMGAALGAALTWPAQQALAVFVALGLGMALPYLLASAWPPLARLLPRPGVWMLHFKVLMAFPMFATVLWLAWVLGVQVGVAGMVALLGVLLALAFVAWALGSPALGPRARRGFGGLALLLMAAALVWAAPALQQDAEAHTASTDAWQPWSGERVAQAQAAGRKVFVDFTAAWCVTCQVNKRTTLAAERVQRAFASENVLLLRADWTRRDPAITAELARLGRSGVPAYVVYTPGTAGPRVLSEILSVSDVLGAIGAPS